MLATSTPFRITSFCFGIFLVHAQLIKILIASWLLTAYYKSIPHHKLIQDIKKYYNDKNVIAMLENIITNPIDTPFGYKNPVHGIALRGPLSQFFSGIYLKPFDDAFSNMDVTYLRYTG